MVSQNLWMVIILILETDFEKRNLLQTVMTTVTYLITWLCKVSPPGHEATTKRSLKTYKK